MFGIAVALLITALGLFAAVGFVAVRSGLSTSFLATMVLVTLAGVAVGLLGGDRARFFAGLSSVLLLGALHRWLRLRRRRPHP